MSLNSFIFHTWVDMGHTWATHGCTWAHMYEHGLHVSWKFIDKLPWIKCPININRGRIPHYLKYVQHEFWIFFVITLLYSYSNLFNTNFGYIFLSQPCFVHVSVCSTLILGTFFFHSLIMFLFCSCNKILFDFYTCHVFIFNSFCFLIWNWN